MDLIDNFHISKSESLFIQFNKYGFYMAATCSEFNSLLHIHDSVTSNCVSCMVQPSNERELPTAEMTRNKLVYVCFITIWREFVTFLV